MPTRMVSDKKKAGNPARTLVLGVLLSGTFCACTQSTMGTSTGTTTGQGGRVIPSGGSNAMAATGGERGGGGDGSTASAGGSAGSGQSNVGQQGSGGILNSGGASGGGSHGGTTGSGGSDASGTFGDAPGGGGGGAGNGNGGSTDAGGNTRSGGSNGNGGAAGGSSGGDPTFIPDPGWACGMADGIVPPTQGTLAFSITLQISATHDVGNTPYGHRRLLDVKGGTITGDRINGSVVTGGLEYELTLSNGVLEFQGINILKTSDNALVYVRSCGVAPDGTATPRVIPDFEATTTGSYAWLNTGKFVATRTVDTTSGSLKLDVYDVSNVTVAEPRIQITKPAGVPKQPWACNATTGARGSSVFTENVTLGTSLSIANAKRGSRNIIPITGGTTTGKVAGAILNGGADYQLSGSLDAWYTLAPSNTDLILVRNCGPMGNLIPWFETRTDGDYNFLNANTFISSDPGGGSGGVGITFYERK
jgi:hypothetical protein